MSPLAPDHVFRHKDDIDRRELVTHLAGKHDFLRTDIENKALGWLGDEHQLAHAHSHRSGFVTPPHIGRDSSNESPKPVALPDPPSHLDGPGERLAWRSGYEAAVKDLGR